MYVKYNVHLVVKCDLKPGSPTSAMSPLSNLKTLCIQEIMLFVFDIL